MKDVYRWQDEALCGRPDVDPDWWYSSRPTERAHAARICNTRCPVKAQCAEAGALERNGIWGGVDRGEEARKAARREEARAKQAAEKAEAARLENRREKARLRENAVRDAYRAYQAGERNPETVRLAQSHMNKLEKKRARHAKQLRLVAAYMSGDRSPEAVTAYENHQEHLATKRAAERRRKVPA